MCFAVAVVQNTALISYAQAHEMEGMAHVDLSNGIVQIIEPIPGMIPAPDVKIGQTKSGVAPKSSQPGGLGSLLIQVVLIFSVIVLLVIVLRATSKQRLDRLPPTIGHPSNPSTPLPPG